MNGDSQKLIMFVHEGIRQLCSKLKDLIEQDGLVGPTSEKKVKLNHLWKTKLYRTYGQISNLEMKFAPPGSKTFSSVFEPFIEWLMYSADGTAMSPNPANRSENVLQAAKGYHQGEVIRKQNITY